MPPERGALAEWLGSGLQSRLQRFESARRLYCNASASEEGVRALMPYVGLGLIVLLILVAGAYVVWRVKNSGEMEAGGSMGHQMFGRDRDDWGLKP
jgi:hypothetical protein